MQYIFPVERILYAVQEGLPKAQTVGLLRGFENGLQNEIELVDRDGAWTGVANISPTGKVTLSVTFCQFLSLLCQISLIVHDSLAVEREVEKMTPVKRDEYERELSVDCEMTHYLRDIPDYESVVKYASRLIDIAKPLLTSTPITQEEYNAIDNLGDYESPLATRANSLCVYGIIFIILHEASHAILGQNLYEEGTEQEEIDADHNAFWAMWGDLEGMIRNTAMMGCICALASLLFYNPNLSKDGVHPREDKRLFSFFDVLKDEKKSYTEMLTIVLSIWATIFGKADFPVLDGSYEETLTKQRDYLYRLQ